MKLEQLRPAYQNFFLKSEEGKAFMAELSRLIDDSHQKAEKDATNSRDYTQHARGVRKVIEHIQSVSAEVSKAQK